MTPQEFGFLRTVLKQRSGLNLGDDKQGLLEQRLRPLLKEFELGSLSALASAAARPEAEYLRMCMAQAVTVQESYFFRDKRPFQDFVSLMLPALLQAREASRSIRIWCAAAATGQEPYSLAMLIREMAPLLDGWSMEILATDFARDALQRARSGTYSQFEVQRGLPVSLLVKYFSKAGRSWQIDERIRTMVAFREHNLMCGAREFGQFDIIFCRNVLIYFDDATKRQVLAELQERLAPDGYLVLGAAETTTGASSAFVSAGEDHRGVFQLAPAHRPSMPTSGEADSVSRAAAGSRR